MEKLIEIKNLILNGGEALRIELHKEGPTYLIADDLIETNPFGVLVKTDRNTFIEAFNQLNWIEDSWSRDLKEDYSNMKEFLKEVI